MSSLSKRLLVVAPIATLSVAVCTFLLVSLGPDPSRSQNADDISDAAQILVEPRDRWILLSWWLIAAALAVIIVVGGPRLVRGRRLMGPLAQWAVAISSVVIAGISVLGDADQAGIWPRVDLLQLLVGASLTALLVLLWRAPRRSGFIVSVVLLALLVVIAIPALVETPAGVRDPDSYRYTSDELIAPAIGRIPYGNYAPQYSALLGLPISPAISAWSGQAGTLVVAWLLLLQITTLVVAVCMSVSAGGRRYLLGSSLLVVAPVIATSPQGFSAATYYAGMPLRVVMPVLTLGLAYAVILRRSTTSRRSIVGFLAVGLAAGATVINNPDFGLPALAAVLLAAALALRTFPDRVRALGLVALGVVVCGIAYAGWAASRGAPVSMDYVLVFQRIFGATGYMSVPMSVGGLHVAVVTLFISASVIGATILTVPPFPGSPWVLKQGVLLTLVGTWSLLSLPYFAGRSYTSTLMSGYALQIGLALSALLPLVDAGLRGLFVDRSRVNAFAWASVSLGLIAITCCVGSLRFVYPPSDYLALAKPGQVPTRLIDQIQQAKDLRSGVGTEQLLDMPALTALLTGVPSHPVVNNPDYLALSRNLAALQCAAGWPSGTKTLVITSGTLTGLRRAPACWEVLDLSGATPDTRSPELLHVAVLG